MARGGGKRSEAVLAANLQATGVADGRARLPEVLVSRVVCVEAAEVLEMDDEEDNEEPADASALLFPS